jgi:hypothetical protein
MNVRRHSLRFATTVVCLMAAATGAETLQLPPSLIGLASDAGGQLFLQSSARQAYWPLSMQFVTQKNQAYCGVATMIMVLNALGVSAPATPGIEPFTTFTQDNVLNEKTELILLQSVLVKKGMTLDQFGKLMQTYGVRTEVNHAASSAVDQFRASAVKYLSAPRHHVVVNYLRRTLGQEKGEHISPLAAYDAKTDRFLILDVSRYKYPLVWVKTEDLFAAMNTVDDDNDGQTRGFVLIE